MAIKKEVKKKTAVKKPTKKITAKKTVKKKPAVKKATVKKSIKKKPIEKQAVKKKAIKKKPIASKLVKKKRPAVKNTTIEKIKSEKVYVRKEVLISSILYNEIIEKKGKAKIGEPKVYLIGENEKHVAQKMIQIAGHEGCNEMPYLSSESLLKAYLALDKRKLLPCGFVRINTQFNMTDAHWHSDSGYAIYRNIGTYMLSSDDGNIVAEIFRPHINHTNYFTEQNKMPQGLIEKLTVRLTDNE